MYVSLYITNSFIHSFIQEKINIRSHLGGLNYYVGFLHLN